VRVIAVFVQEFGEAGVVRPAVFFEQRRADLGDRNLE